MPIIIFKLHTNGYNSFEEFFVGHPSVNQLQEVLSNYYGEEFTQDHAEVLYHNGDVPIPGNSGNWISLDAVNHIIGDE